MIRTRKRKTNIVPDYSQEELNIENFNTKLGLALNSCQRTYDSKDSRNFLIEFNPEISSHVEALSEKQFFNYISLGFTCKFLMDNNVDHHFHKETGNWIDEKINEIINIKKEKKEQIKDSSKNHDIQLAILHQIREKMGEIDGFIEDFIFDKKTDFNLIQYIKSTGLSPIHVRKIYNHYNKEKEEYNIALSSTEINKYDDKGLIGEISYEADVKEAYRWITNSRFKKIINFYDEFLKELDNYIKLNATRRTKQVKKPSIQKMVAKVKYLKESKELGIVSLNPDKIVGASMAVLFNEKTRKIAIFNAMDRGGLQIKGTSIFNYDEKTSMMKTVRSYVNMQEFAQKPKTGINNDFKDLTTKETPANSRINIDTLILKVF